MWTFSARRPRRASPTSLALLKSKLAEEYRLSQGAVCKAIEAMASEGLVSRRAGRGTFVTSHRNERRPVRFKRLLSDSDQKIAGDNAEFIFCRDNAADLHGAKALCIAAGEPVIETLRLRRFEGRPMLVGRIVIPLGLMPTSARISLLKTSLDLARSPDCRFPLSTARMH